MKKPQSQHPRHRPPTQIQGLQAMVGSAHPTKNALLQLVQDVSQPTCDNIWHNWHLSHVAMISKVNQTR